MLDSARTTNRLADGRGPRPGGWAITFAIVAALLLAYPLRYVLLPFVAAGALTYVARPLVNWLGHRFRFPRWVCALIAFLLFLGVLAAAGYWVATVLVPELSRMTTDSPRLLEQFLSNLFHGHNIELAGRTITPREAANDAIRTVQKYADPDQIVEAAVTGVTAMMGMVLTVVLLAFFMFGGPQLAQGFLRLIPPALRPRVRSLALQIDPMLGRYLRGLVVVVLFTSGVTYIVTGLIFHVSHAIVLAIAVGLLELLPVIGPLLSFVTFGLVAVQETGFATIIGFGMFAIALRLVIDQVVGPLVLGRAARIPAVVVIFSFLAGGVLYGMLGVVLAIPFAATVKIVLLDLYGEGAADPLPTDSEVPLREP